MSRTIRREAMSKSQVFLLPGPQYPLLQQSASPKKGGKRSIETKSRELVKAEAAIPVLPPHIVCLNDGEINFFSPNPIQIPSIERREEARSLHPNPSMKKGPCLERFFPVTPVDPRLGSGLGIAEWAHFFSPALHFSPRELQLSSSRSTSTLESPVPKSTTHGNVRGMACDAGTDGLAGGILGGVPKKRTQKHISTERECATRGAMDVTRPLAEAPDRLFPQQCCLGNAQRVLTFTISVLCWLGGETGHTDTLLSTKTPSIRTGDLTSKDDLGPRLDTASPPSNATHPL